MVLFLSYCHNDKLILKLIYGCDALKTHTSVFFSLEKNSFNLTANSFQAAIFICLSDSVKGLNFCIKHAIVCLIKRKIIH